MDPEGKVSPQSPEQSPGEAQQLGNMRAYIPSLRLDEGPPGIKHPTFHGKDGVESDKETEGNYEQRNFVNKLETPKHVKQRRTKKTKTNEKPKCKIF